MAQRSREWRLISGKPSVAARAAAACGSARWAGEHWAAASVGHTICYRDRFCTASTHHKKALQQMPLVHSPAGMELSRVAVVLTKLLSCAITPTQCAAKQLLPTHTLYSVEHCEGQRAGH